MIPDINRVLWECKCDCGNIIKALGYNLKNGHTRSCGCLREYSFEKGEVGLKLLMYRYRNGATYRGLKFELPVEDFKKLTKDNCYYCGQSPNRIMKSKSDNSEYLYNGIDRLDSNIGYLSGNIVTCCIVCNRMKMVLNHDNFINKIKYIYNNIYNKGEEKKE